MVAAAGLGDYFRSRFTAGDEEAIFEFAAQDKTVLRSRWVVTVLEAWQREGSQTSQRKVTKFTRQFLKQPRPGERTPLVKIIAADQTAFKDVVNLHHYLHFPLPEAARLVAQRLGWPEALVAEVYHHYRPVADSFFQLEDDGPVPWPQVFEWLHQCLENLKQL